MFLFQGIPERNRGGRSNEKQSYKGFTFSGSGVLFDDRGRLSYYVDGWCQLYWV